MTINKKAPMSKFIGAFNTSQKFSRRLLINNVELLRVSGNSFLFGLVHAFKS